MSEQANKHITEIEMKFDKLPSKGLGYPADGKILYRGYTFGEIGKISNLNRNHVTLELVVQTALEGIKTVGFDKSKLSFVDVLLLGLYRRVSSQGELQFEMPYQCAKCKSTKGKAVFSHGDIEFSDIENAAEITLFPVEAEVAGKELKISYPTVGNMLDPRIKAKKNKAVAIQALQITNMDFEEAYKFIEGLDILTQEDDIDVLRDVDKILHHDIKPIKATCKNKVLSEKTGTESVCNHVNQVDIEGKELIIRPFRRSDEPNRSKIRTSR
jgi:hypothetical protein